jgi:hypothetical protein
MAVQQVDLMSDAQKHVHLITLDIPIENIQTSLIDDLAEKCEAFAGNTPLHLRVFDEIKQNLITLIAPSIRMDRAFYQWIKQQENEDIFTHIVQ